MLSEYVEYIGRKLQNHLVESHSVNFCGQKFDYIKVSYVKNTSDVVHEEILQHNIVLFLDIFQGLYEWIDVLKPLLSDSFLWILPFNALLPSIVGNRHGLLFDFLYKNVFITGINAKESSFFIISQGYCARELFMLGDSLKFKKMILYEPYGMTKLPYIFRLPFLDYLSYFGYILSKAKFYFLEICNLYFCFLLFLVLKIIVILSKPLISAIDQLISVYMSNNCLVQPLLLMREMARTLNLVGNDLGTFMKYCSDKYMFCLWRKNGMELTPCEDESRFIILGNESPNNYYDACKLVGYQNLYEVENYNGIFPFFYRDSVSKLLSEIINKT